VIDPAPDRFRAIRPLHSVIEGAAGKEDDCSQSEDSQGHTTP